MSVESIVIATDLNKTFKAEQKGLDDVQALQGSKYADQNRTTDGFGRA